MATFLKAQAASLTATIVDFALTIVLKQYFHVWYLVASVVGTVIGGAVNFMMNRSWTFKAHHKKVHHQAIKYVLVWIGNLVLVSGGVFLLTNYGKVNYVISKVVVSLIVGFLYNYILQKRFVFK